MPSPLSSPHDPRAAATSLSISALGDGAGVRLLGEVMERAGEVRMRVTGRSMAPFLRGGEILTLAKVTADSLRRGDLILFTRPSGRPKLHRIIRVANGGGGGRLFMTGGDALAGHDAAVREEEILGKARIVEHPASLRGPLRLESRGWRLRSALAAFVWEARIVARAAASRAARRAGRARE